MIILIVAMDRNRAIGLDGKIPWHLPADLRRFKKLTTGHTIVMGRKTYESIGHPLPDRTNVVVSRQKDFRPRGCRVVGSLNEALDVKDDVYVIGGGEIYAQALPRADRAYITEVDTRVKGADSHFPALDPSEWKREDEEIREADAENPFRFRFLTFARKQGRLGGRT